MVKDDQGTARVGRDDDARHCRCSAPRHAGRTLSEGEESNPKVVVRSFDTWRSSSSPDKAHRSRGVPDNAGATRACHSGLHAAELEFPPSAWNLSLVWGLH